MISFMDSPLANSFFLSKKCQKIVTFLQHPSWSFHVALFAWQFAPDEHVLLLFYQAYNEYYLTTPAVRINIQQQWELWEQEGAALSLTCSPPSLPLSSSWIWSQTCWERLLCRPWRRPAKEPEPTSWGGRTNRYVTVWSAHTESSTDTASRNTRFCSVTFLLRSSTEEPLQKRCVDSCLTAFYQI